MKKLICFFCLLLFFFLSLSAQEVSMVIDNQTPGWLSSQFTYNQRQSVEDLTVTGYIDKTDMTFINSLIKDYNLKVLDLSEVNLTEPAYGENIIWVGFLSFGTNKVLQKFTMPFNIKGINTSTSSNRIAAIVSHVDTLIIGNTDLTVFGVATTSLISYFAPEEIVLLDGVEVIPNCSFSFACNTDAAYYNTEPAYSHISLSNTLKTIGGRAFGYGSLIDEPLKLPNSIEYLGKHPLVYDSWAGHYGRSEENRWWYKNDFEISKNKFEFPSNLRFYNSLGYSRMSDGSTREVYSTTTFESDTIVVGAFCDTLYAKLKAKIAFFYNEKPVKPYNSSKDFVIDTLYVPENCGELYEEAYKYALGKNIKVIKEMTSIQAIEIDGIADELYVGETLQLSAHVIPDDAFDQRLQWSCSNPEIASVDNNGLVTALRSGEVDIIAKSLANDTVEGHFQIRVLQHVEGLALNLTDVTIWNGDTVRLTPIFTPSNATNKNVVWKSVDENVAIVYDGIVKGKNAGQTIITCTSEDGQYIAQCNVTVQQHVEHIELYKHELSLNVGAQEQLRFSVYPNNASVKSVNWNSSNEDFVTVNESGLVSAIKAGSSWIIVSSRENPEVKDSCLVTVIQPVNGISLNYSNVELNAIGETIQIVANVMPEDASNKEVRWASSDESVCIVSNGTVVAVGFGTCVIIATTVDGNHIATCTVNVIEKINLPGDVNNDGEVNIADINAIIDIILGNEVGDETRERADVNGDGEINIADINRIIDIILK